MVRVIASRLNLIGRVRTSPLRLHNLELSNPHSALKAKIFSLIFNPACFTSQSSSKVVPTSRTRDKLLGWMNLMVLQPFPVSNCS